MKIMIIEDDTALANEVEQALTKWQYEVSVIKDFKTIMKQFVQVNPQLVLIDITLPEYDGFYWCEQIRKVSHVPIIFFSSRSDYMTQIMALKLGGDDFVEKPFQMEFLASKIEVLIRRTYGYNQEQTLLFAHDYFVFDPLANHITTDSKEIITLSRTETVLLKILFENRGKFVSRGKLIRDLWQDEQFIDENTLSVNMNRLRKKMETLNPDYTFIETKRGVGYSLT
ncbi:MAG: response regulator transcription factor [Culicoidibacterales bacterium]